MDTDGIPAWMVCNELLVRLKDEFIVEATEVLHIEMKAERIVFKGKLISLPESAGEMEKDLYIIRHLVADQQELRVNYEKKIAEITSSAVKDPKVVERVEQLKKFLLALTQISMLMHYSSVLNSLADETGKYANKIDQSEIIRLAIGDREVAVDAVKFALDSKVVKLEGVINDKERVILEKALEK